MTSPEFMQAFPSLDVPFPDDVVQTSDLRSDAGMVGLFTSLKDMDLPRHFHGAK